MQAMGLASPGENVETATAEEHGCCGGGVERMSNGRMVEWGGGRKALVGSMMSSMMSAVMVRSIIFRWGSRRADAARTLYLPKSYM